MACRNRGFSSLAVLEFAGACVDRLVLFVSDNRFEHSPLLSSSVRRHRAVSKPLDMVFRVVLQFRQINLRGVPKTRHLIQEAHEGLCHECADWLESVGFGSSWKSCEAHLFEHLHM